MSRSLEFAETTLRRMTAAHALVVPAALLLATATLANPALAERQTATLIVTGNTAPVYPVLTDEPPVEDPRGAFERELLRLKQQHPDALLVEAGRFLSVSVALESGYDSPPIFFRTDNGFDVVNLTAMDSAIGTVTGVNYQLAPIEALEPLIAGYQSQHPRDIPELKTSIDVNSAGGMPLTFVSMPDDHKISGLPGKAVDLVPFEGDNGAASAVVRAGNAGRVAVGITELPQTGWSSELGDAKLPDVMFDFELDSTTRIEQVEESWRIAAPALGEILVVQLERQNTGAIARPQIEVARWLPAGTDAAELTKYPVPRLGLRIPNIAHIAERDLGGNGTSTWFDIVSSSDLEPGLTSTSEVAAYHVEIPEGKRRIYRVIALMPDWQKPEYGNRGYPQVDMLVLVDENHVLRGVLTRNNFPVGTTATALRDALHGLAGQAPEDWKPDPQKTGGIEPLWDWATGDMKRVLTLDRLLYGETGLLKVGR